MEPVVVTEVPIKKKRGRKPKEVVVDATPKTVNIIESLNALITSETDKPSSSKSVPEIVPKAVVIEPVEDAPKKGKRGRKPKYVYSASDITTIDEANNAATSDDDNVIVRLNIPEPEVKNEFIDSQEEQPYAYNHDTYTNLSNISDMSHLPHENIIVNETKNKATGAKVVNVLQEFEEKNKNNEWPLNTSTSCYWCCHRFDNAPVGIPINYMNDAFEVFGCFCSLECAAAYNFNENINQDEMWERYQLINLLSRKMKLGNIVKAAPPRLGLKTFGGHMDIDTFRGFSKGNKFININFPPMTSITQQLEEINDFEISNDFKYIPVDNERINKYKEKIVFKRNKPLIDTNKSLESTMNLKYQ